MDVLKNVNKVKGLLKSEMKRKILTIQMNTWSYFFFVIFFEENRVFELRQADVVVLCHFVPETTAKYYSKNFQLLSTFCQTTAKCYSKNFSTFINLLSNNSKMLTKELFNFYQPFVKQQQNANQRTFQFLSTFCQTREKCYSKHKKIYF